MSLASAVLARRLRLPRAQTRDVVCQRDLRVAMDDGAVLLADRWVARAVVDRPQPTVLVRSPYGRRQLVGLTFGRILAERGLQVVVQSVRGTFGSEGRFSPFDERADGLATLRWIRRQPWQAERIGMIGPSYLGLVQWAVAPEAGDDLAALAIHVSASQFHGQAYAGGSLSLESAASWLVLVAAQERRLAPLTMVRGLRRLPALFAQLPITEIDARATGAEVPWFREALASPQREDPYWVARDFAAGVEEVTAAVQLVGGWYDIFLPWMLEDFAALRAAGRDAQLVIGPWTHTAPGLLARGMREGIAWLRARLLGDDRLVSPAMVRVLVTGERTGGGWREFPNWRRRAPASDGCGSAAGERLREPDRPAGRRPATATDTTPPTRRRHSAGPCSSPVEPVVDNRRLEARPDVLTRARPRRCRRPWTRSVRCASSSRCARARRTSTCSRACAIVDGGGHGTCATPARVLHRAASNRPRTASGASPSTCGPWATASPPAHRVRLQLSSAPTRATHAAPAPAEDLATATRLRPVDVEVLHGAAPVGARAATPDVTVAWRRGTTRSAPCRWRPVKRTCDLAQPTLSALNSPA